MKYKVEVIEQESNYGDYRVEVRYADRLHIVGDRTYEVGHYVGIGEADEYGDAFAIAVFNLWKLFDDDLFALARKKEK